MRSFRSVKNIIRNRLNNFGFDIVRVARPLRASAESGIGFYKTEIGNYYLPLNAPDDGISRHMQAGRIFEPEFV